MVVRPKAVRRTEAKRSHEQRGPLGIAQNRTAMKREDTKTKVNDPMSTVPTDKNLSVTPGVIHVARLGGQDLYNDKRVYMGTASGSNGTGRANAQLWCDAHNTYNKTFLLPSELAEQLEEALTHLSQMFEGFDFESGLGKPEAADAENAWNFLLSHTNVRTSPTDPTPPEK